MRVFKLCSFKLKMILLELNYPNLDKPKPNRMPSRNFIYLCFGLSKLASKIYECIFYFINVLILSLAFTSKELLHKFCHSTLPIKFLPNLPDGSQEKARI